MKWIVGILAGLIGLVVLCVVALWLYGLRGEAGHSVGEVVIDRPPAQVFRWLTDDNRLRKWIGGLSDIREVAAPPNGGEIGRKFRMTESYGGQSVQMEAVVTRFEQDRAISISVSSVDDPGNGFTETADYTLTDLGGKTHLRLDGKAKYFSFMPRLLEPVITPKATEKLAEDLARMKSLVEAEPAASAAPVEMSAKPGLEMEKLKFLVGKWTYTETYEKTPFYPNGGQNKGTYDASLGPAGFSVLNNFHSTGPVGDFQGHQVLAWSAKDQRYESYIVGNFPGSELETGTWKGNDLEFTGDFDAGRQKLHLRSVTTPTGPKTATIHEYIKAGDAPEQLMLTTQAMKQ